MGRKTAAGVSRCTQRWKESQLQDSPPHFPYPAHQQGYEPTPTSPATVTQLHGEEELSRRCLPCERKPKRPVTDAGELKHTRKYSRRDEEQR